MGIIFSIIGAISGLSGMVFAVIGFFHNRMVAVATYMEYTREPDFIEARSFVFELREYDSNLLEKERENADKAEYLINTYNLIGLLVRKHQLPKWLFKETSMGDMVIMFYTKLEPYIIFQREKTQIKTYANQFEYLCMLIKEKT